MTAVVLWEVKVKPGLWDKVAEITRGNLEGTRTYPGCQRIDMCRDQQDPDRMMLVEYWDSIEDYRKYVQWRIDTGVLPEFMNYCDGAAVLQTFDILD